MGEFYNLTLIIPFSSRRKKTNKNIDAAEMMLGSIARALAGGGRRVVGGEGRGRGVGGDGATAMGCWLRGRSAWEDERVQGKGRGVECGRLGAKALRGIRGVRGQVRDRRDQRDQRASRGVGGSGEGPGAVGDAWT